LGLGEKKTDGSGSVAGGLRMVVFGGGDVATPGLSSSKTSDKVSAWTEVMCQNVKFIYFVSFSSKKLIVQ
jgi:hypothetical protein